METHNRAVGPLRSDRSGILDGQRSLKTIGFASSALITGPAALGVGRISLLEGADATRRGWVLDVLSNWRGPLRVGRNPSSTQNKPTPPVGPPFLLGVPLYDWRDEGLHDLFSGFAVQLDRASGIDVFLEVLDNPKEIYPVYRSLRSVTLRRRDAANAAAYLRKIRQGLGPDHVRRIEVDKLAGYLQVPSEALPCIAFLPFPVRLPTAVFAVKRTWIDSREQQVRFATALRQYFESTSVRDLVNEATTNIGLAETYVKQMTSWFARQLEDVCQANAVRSPVLDDLGWYPSSQLAKHFGVRPGALRRRLDRYRDDHDAGWIENKVRRPREARFLYRPRDVRSTIEDLQASSERASK